MKEKSYRIKPLTISDITIETRRSIVKRTIEEALAKCGLVADNLDDVLQKHITEEMCNEQKEGQ